MNKAAKNLQKLYRELGDARTDVRNKNMYLLLLSYVKGKTLLDIGCGALHFLYHAKKKGLEAEGLEPDKVLVKLGQQLYGKVGKIYSVSVEKLDAIKKKYDAISMIDVLEHVKDDKQALLKIKKRLNKNGRLIILVPAWQFLYGERDKDIGHYRRYSGKHLREVLEQSGYVVDRIAYWNMLGFFTYLFFVKLLRKGIVYKMRTKKKGFIGKMIHPLIDSWVRNVENKFNLGFGLSLIAIAKKRTQ